MCLETNWKRPKTAEKTIECYKVFVKCKNNLVSPYRMTQLSSDSIGKVLYAKGDKCPKEIDDKTVYIGSGYYHMFTNKEDAETFMEDVEGIVTLFHAGKGKLKIYKIVIPMGAKYYMSIGEREICADKIIIKDEVDLL